MERDDEVSADELQIDERRQQRPVLQPGESEIQDRGFGPQFEHGLTHARFLCGGAETLRDEGPLGFNAMGRFDYRVSRSSLLVTTTSVAACADGTSEGDR